MITSLFSPSNHQTVWDVQVTIRRIDISLTSIFNNLVTEQALVYSTLTGCCMFLDSPSLSQLSTDIQKFAYDIVEPVILECFKEITNFHYKLDDSSLKVCLLKKIQRLQYYPKFYDFELIEHKELIEELQKIIQVGQHTLYKIDPLSPKFYGGRIDICDEAFIETGKILEKYGYKNSNDMLGSAFDGKGHVTTISPIELAENYESVVKNHETFIKHTQEVSLKPISLRIGLAQSGRISRLVAVNLEIANLSEYRATLGSLKIPPHLTVFCQKIQPISQLQNLCIGEIKSGVYINKLMRYLFKANGFKNL